jgi:hypothetical protein
MFFRYSRIDLAISASTRVRLAIALGPDISSASIAGLLMNSNYGYLCVVV